MLSDNWNFINTIVQWIPRRAYCLISMSSAITGVPMSGRKTAIITGASRGIGAGLVKAFLEAGYNVAATARSFGDSFVGSPTLVLVEGDIGTQATAANTVNAAVERFGRIDVLVHNAGIYYTKPFTDFTTEDFNAFASTELLGFIYITQLSVKQMVKQESGCVVTISASLADRPVSGVNVSIPMIAKGGLNAITRSLAMEYSEQGIRFNAVAPGMVDTPPCKNDPIDFAGSLEPMRDLVEVNDITDAVLYLAAAGHLSGEILHVDRAANTGYW
jgi:NAD(P)-dependent dehydrogenase (short-subunit alcohol dehydrogenase family)